MEKNSLKIFGVEILDYKKKEIFEKVDDALENNKKLFITTLNPEILLKTEKDEGYRNILNDSDLKIIDGFGIKLISFLKRKKIGERMTGAGLSRYILEKAKELNLKVGFAMRKGGLSQKEELREKIYELGIKNFIIEEMEPAEINLNTANIDVLLVGLGAPYQEKFIWRTKNQFPNLKLAMGVGGTFDFWTGKQKRAPKFMRKIGLEWLWRLFIQPNRAIRIWKSTVVFLWKNLIK